MAKRKKSYATGKLKGPPAPKEWWNYKKSGACPVVIDRKLGYVVTRLNDLAKVENLYAEVAALPELERHPSALQNLRDRVKNKQEWLDYSVTVLRNCVRFAIARIDPENPDHQLLIELRKQAGIPYKYECGRVNRRFHERLHYYSKVLDDYILAKTAVSGTSQADDAMKEVWSLCSKIVARYKNRTAREKADAEQQAALGIIKACQQYQPAKDGKLAKLTTFATFKVWRATQARKASHCRAGLAMVGETYKSVASIHKRKDDDSADAFHPKAATTDTGMVYDVHTALASLPDELREVAEAGLLYGRKHQDIADELGISINRVRGLLKRAKEDLALKLQDHAAG